MRKTLVYIFELLPKANFLSVLKSHTVNFSSPYLFNENFLRYSTYEIHI